MRKFVMTKKDKYRSIASRVFDIVGVTNYFYGRWDAVRNSYTEEEKEIHSKLWRVYMDGLTPKHPNNPEYDKYIQMVLAFVKSVVDKYVPEEQRKHGNGSDFSFDFLERNLNAKEVEDWKVGSNFTCMLSENVEVKKIALETDENGSWKNHIYGLMYSSNLTTNFLPPVANLSEGLYEVVGTGERFDINDDWGDLELTINDDNKDTHPIINNFELETEALNESSDEDYDYSYDQECSRCRGGGCPQCDTTGFFTGIRIM